MPSEPRAFPLVVGILSVLLGLVLIARGAIKGGVSHRPWSARALALIAVIVIVVSAALQFRGDGLLLLFGPPEFVAATALQLAIALALARASRLRAAGMVLLGLLMSAVGIDISTGLPRLTFGIEALLDGIRMDIVALGLLVAADGALCAASPSAFLAAYARQIAGTTAPVVSAVGAHALRLAGFAAVAASGAAAYALDGSAAPLVPLAVFAVFGVACRIYGWNRLVLLLALGVGTMLEENIRRALLLARGNPEIFLRTPFDWAMFVASCAVLAWASGIFTTGKSDP